jgi:uncharacterized protein (DUF2141 family)
LKKPVTIIGLIGCLAVCQAQETTSLTVTIDKLENTQGQLLIALFDRPEGFPEEGATAFRSLKLAIEDTSVKVCFGDLPPGIYAVCFIHDKNMNEKLDKKIRIPSEKYGVSNNIKMAFGPPDFDEAKFYLGRKDTSILITPAF